MLHEEIHIKVEHNYEIESDVSEDDDAYNYDTPTIKVEPNQDPLSQEGAYAKICQELECDPQLYFHYFNMSKTAFDKLHELVKDDIAKQNTNYRSCIESKERLMICLRYLKTGHTYNKISNDYHIGKTIVARIIVEVSHAIFENLRQQYMPKLTENIWKENQQGFKKKCKVPNCVGAIVGRHIKFSYKRKQHQIDSLVFLAITNADHLFTIIDTGSYGSLTETRVFEKSPLYKFYLTKKKFLAPPTPFPGSDSPVPTVLVGDTEFPLCSFLMRPFPLNLSKKDPRIKKYNVRMRRARRVGDSTLTLLTNKWRMFHYPLKCTSAKAVHCVRAACILHNYIRMQPDSDLETDEQLKSLKLSDPLRLLKTTNRRSSSVALDIRQKFVDYFNR